MVVWGGLKVALEELASGQIDKAFTDKDLVQHCIAAKDYVEDTIRSKRDLWQTAWNEYLGNVDFSDKAEWQSKAHLPKFGQAVRITKNLMKQSIIKADDFFSFEGVNEKARMVEKDITRGVKRAIDQSKFKQKHFANGVFRGLLENLIIFKTWVEPLGGEEPIHPDQQFKFPVSVVSAFDLFVDPTGRQKFIIHRIKMDVSDFRRLVNRGVYERDSLDLVLADFERKEEEIKEKIRQGQHDITPPEWRKEVELLEYWGDVDDERGNTIHRNVTFTIANGRAIARKPITNPFRHKKPPFVWGPIFERHGSEYHEGFGDQILDIAKMINETLNMILDSHIAASMKAYEVDLNLVHNPSSLKSGIYPGKVIQVNGVPPGSQAVRDFSLGSINPSSLQVLASLDREMQNASGVNEFISGIVGVGDKTATEVKQKAGQSIGFMQAVAEDIEDNVLNPFVQMVYSNILQYNPEILGDRVSQLPMEDLRFKFNVKGMSKILQQMDELGKIFQWVGMVAKTPIGQQINWNEIATMSARLINQDPAKILLQAANESPEVDEGVPNPELSGEQGQLQVLQQLAGGLS